MGSELQSKILKALFTALRPLARALLRAGIGYKEFAEVSKAAFVIEASEGYGVRGRLTNISRVAVMTGITRKEVKKLREQELNSFFSDSIAESPASVILSQWHTNPDYCDENNIPNILSYEGSDHSFTQLVKVCAGDLPAGAIRTELKRINAIVELPDGRLKAEQRHFVPSGLDDRIAIGLADVVGADLSTLAYNCDPGLSRSTRYHRVTSVDGMPEELARIAEGEAKARCIDFANDFDNYLTDLLSRGANSINGERASKQVGIGMFFFERDLG